MNDLKEFSKSINVKINTNKVVFLMNAIHKKLEEKLHEV